MSRQIKVERIKEGTVIDHISCGQALNVMRILGITKEYPSTAVTVAMNVSSPKSGRKDIVKIEGRELKGDEVDKISLISPHATINIIRNSGVVEKRNVSLPVTLEGVVTCANPNCITRFEDTVSKFKVERRDPIRLRCLFCERVMEQKAVINQF
ncbi:MAG TPA: aspartate carbamoyltransferase regulatory subunit [Euryarchaeota archaeon]|nr:aspartate carbamoyltransferase regulatory chain [archaeon BMS3Abin16]GBE55882.1 aspartate carbamoyltransferase regulatory chain [archaeon BMS3Bbin16]HDH28393.1 aspartate carbamoyltransferase regulatory subunit [Euryarchaeota archaeon]HDY73819.1 aspartate carbamoyltransferase regulatory subunit [Euryarchaeota archaeon]